METERTERKAAPSPLRRVGRVGLSLVNPFSDLGIIYRRGVRPVLNTLARVRDVVRARREVNRDALTWAQAVALTGVSVERLHTNYLRIRAFWWFLMLVCGGLAMVLLLMVMVTFISLPGAVLLRAMITALILTLLGGAGFVNALIATYRLWQLNTRRVSQEEKGTFGDFCAENRWGRQVVSLGYWC